MDEFTPPAERARALENAGQLDSALDLYLQAVAAEPDPVIWNRIGDLRLRSGGGADAVSDYARSVQLFVHQGQRNNAIAVCRKALHAAPDRDELLLDMGRIAAELGYRDDARAAFQQYADRREQAGEVEAALGALRGYVEHFPGEITVRRGVVERLLAYDRADEAVAELRSLRRWLLREGRADEAEQVWDEIAGLDPSAVPDASAMDPEAVAPEEEEEEGFAGFAPLEGLEPTLATDAPGAGDADGGMPTDVKPQPLDGLELASADAGESHVEPLDPLQLAGLPEIEPGDVAPLEGLEPTTSDADDLEAEMPDALPVLGDDAPVVMRFEHAGSIAVGAQDEAEADGSDEAEPLPLLDVAAWDDPETPATPEPAEPPITHPAPAEPPEPVESERTEPSSLPSPAHAAHPLAALQASVEAAAASGDRRALLAAWLGLARHFRAQGDDGRARVVYQRVLEIEPEHEEARTALASDASAAAPADTAAAPVVPPPPAPSAQDGDGYVDLGSLILGDDEPLDGTRFQVAVGDPTGDEERDFQEILGLFRQQIATHIDPGDATSHYDLGVAFKEMGLLDDAILQLQAALRGGANTLATLELLGECFADKGDHALAARVLTHASRLNDISDNDLLAVLYLLGRSEEALGNPAVAEGCYERVVALDFGFRDAAARLQSIRRLQTR